jgi:hypothetical protein
MNNYKLSDFTKGWVIGDFLPTISKNSNFELAVKNYLEGEFEPKHYQKIATEITIVIEGEILLGGEKFTAGDIIEIPPMEAAEFRSITSSTLVCLKYPSVPNDKVLSDG